MMNAAMPRSTPSSAAHSGSAAPYVAPLRIIRRPVHVVRGVARIQPTGMGAEWTRIPERVHLLVVEVVVAHRIRAKFGVVGLRPKHQWRTAAPASYELRGEQFLLIRCFRMLEKVVAERRDVFLQSAVRHVAAVA